MLEQKGNIRSEHSRVTCQSDLALVKRYIGIIGGGARQVFLIVSSKLYRLIWTLSMSHLTQQAYVHISTVPALSKKAGDDQAIGRSRGGLTAKIHAVVDALGNPIAISLTPWQTADITEAQPLIEESGIYPDKFLADGAYDGDGLIAWLESRKTQPVIPPKANRIWQNRPRKSEICSSIDSTSFLL